jgi:eukaryotic-like serine/threonine-protein kinase
MIGKIISHYKILEKLGEGGMGEVYKAEDTKLERTVAIKFLPSKMTFDEEAKKRFIHEAKAASSLEDNNICNIHEIDQTEDGQLFVVMACYEGETLKDKIEKGPLKIDEVTDYAVQISNGLTKAHNKGIVHRDIKPSNIFITSEGIVKIIDFGLAKLSGKTVLTREGSTLGTVNFMSPEQIRGEEVDRRTDIWALGIVMYQMITGQQPFKGDYEQAVFYSIINEEPEPVTGVRTGVPVELERIVNKALAKNPDERYQHVDEMLVDLKHTINVSSSSSSPQQIKEPFTKKSAKWKKVLFSSLIGILLVAVFIIVQSLLSYETVAGNPKPIAVIAFDNQTGDKSYDYLREAIPNLLITSLEQSKYLRVMTWERMHDVLKQMGKKDVNKIDKNLGFELCRREGVNAIVIGSFIKAGETFATDVKVLDVGTKEILETASARGDGVQSIIEEQIDKLSKEISKGVGLSTQKIEASPAQIAEVTTSSMEAYNFFLRGREEYEKLYYTNALKFLEKAVSLDSNFSMAYLYLSKTYGQLLQPLKSQQSILKAKTLSSKAPEKERLVIESRYASVIEKNSSKSLAILKEMVERYPMEKRFHDELGITLQSKGMLNSARKEFEKAIQLDPNFASPTNGLAYIYAEEEKYDKAIKTLQRYSTLSPGDANPFDSMGEIYLKMGKLDESIAKYREAIRLQPSFYTAYQSLAYVYALKENYPQCLSLVDSLLTIAPTPAIEANTRAWKSSYLSYVGRFNESVHEVAMLKKLIHKIGIQGFYSPLYWLQGWQALNRGDVKTAQLKFQAFNKQFYENNPQTPVFNKSINNYHFAFIYLKKGRIDSARLRFGEIRRCLDSVESYKSVFKLMTGVLEAELLLSEGKPDEAINVYRGIPVMSPSMRIGFWLPFYNTPALRDVVPRAFLKKGEPDSAITEYEKLIRINPDNKDRRLILPFYHYRLAKVCEETGKYNKAREEYRRFLKLWKNADKDLPQLIDAKKRLARIEMRKE